MNEMIDRMSTASNKATTGRDAANPSKGDLFRCDTCGMEVQVTADCHCEHAGMDSNSR